MASEHCRHRRTWLIVDGHAEWCYQCGAWRQMRHVGPTTVAPAGRWTRPTGPGGDNPAARLRSTRGEEGEDGE